MRRKQVKVVFSDVVMEQLESIARTTECPVAQVIRTLVLEGLVK
jgi:hypothetical protein